MEQAPLASQRKSKGLGCLALFAVPFALIGTGMFYLTVSTIIRSVQMSDWPTIPATLTALELKDTSGKSKTQYVAAEYRYEYLGKQFTGKRVSLYSADNIGSFHQDLYDSLAEQLRSGNSISIHVNPADPAQSIINPDLRWGMLAFYMIFVATFGMVGWGLILVAFLGYRDDKKKAELQQLHPGQPWMWDVQWKNKKILSLQKTQAIFVSLAAFFWNAITLPVLTAIPREVQRGNYAVLLVLLFTVIGVGLVVAAVVAVMRWRRFGKAWLELQTLPGRPGASFRAVVHPGVRLEGVSKLTVELRCEEMLRRDRRTIYVASHGRLRGRASSSVHTQTVWDTIIDIPPSRIATALHESPIQVEIPLPQGARDSAPLEADRNGIRWVLTIRAALTGPDFTAQFEVPVFK